MLSDFGGGAFSYRYSYVTDGAAMSSAEKAAFEQVNGAIGNSAVIHTATITVYIPRSPHDEVVATSEGGSGYVPPGYGLYQRMDAYLRRGYKEGPIPSYYSSRGGTTWTSINGQNRESAHGSKYIIDSMNGTRVKQQY